MPKFGAKSGEVKSTLNPVLSLLCDSVVKHFDISLLQGRRGESEQNEFFRLGLSSLKWPDSKHNAKEEDPFPKNLSMAVDVTPYPVPVGFGEIRSSNTQGRDLEWKERVKFYQMVAVFKFEWSRLQAKYKSFKSFKLRFGADWDGDGDFRDQTFDDLVHIEIREI